MRALLAAAVWATTAAAHGACPPTPADGTVLTKDGVRLAWRVEQFPVVQGRPFALLLTVCPMQALLTAVDATMPEHRHGMNYRPTLQPLGEGRWRAEGLLWHMSGRWELRFDVHHQDRTQTLRQDVLLP
ncbi:MAG: hypothetical protein IPF94_09395 [Betaproteobacteria bacterium]|nr:hypothetical protein [Betaproteobacteria bacterium]